MVLDRRRCAVEVDHEVRVREGIPVLAHIDYQILELCHLVLLDITAELTKGALCIDLVVGAKLVQDVEGVELEHLVNLFLGQIWARVFL